MYTTTFLASFCLIAFASEVLLVLMALLILVWSIHKKENRKQVVAHREHCVKHVYKTSCCSCGQLFLFFVQGTDKFKVVYSH